MKKTKKKQTKTKNVERHAGGLSAKLKYTYLLTANLHGSLSVTNRDGNCLFNDISLVLFGHENASSEIRLKTFFELFDNAAFYERIHVKSFIPDVSPPLASAIRQCTQIGSYSCTWTMHAASTVIGKPIKSVYPVVNGPVT